MSRREKFQGTRVPLAKVYEELGDPSTWAADAEALERNNNTPYSPDSDLVGTCRLFGGEGPIYRVMSVSEGYADIEFPESGEKIKVPVAAVRLDPLNVEE